MSRCRCNDPKCEQCGQHSHVLFKAFHREQDELLQELLDWARYEGLLKREDCHA